MVIIFTCNQGYVLTLLVTLLHAVRDTITNTIVTRLDAAMVTTAMTRLQC